MTLRLNWMTVECNLLAPGLSSPATVERSEGASNPCLAEVFAISIKKEFFSPPTANSVQVLSIHIWSTLRIRKGEGDGKHQKSKHKHNMNTSIYLGKGELEDS
ncbi:hypothetical protein E2C01_031821 [Portunus trituberculatus]|uniref:Uncharacterized protein n=1 Tax=Portunus trituberculatus TaxID=210409 RepID=A0A5B7EYW0_PORTR|nr:hypothetical protein [Portunus trituberculatus]